MLPLGAMLASHHLAPGPAREPSLAAHTLAKLTALATFALLIIGGIVNPTGSSLACPEPTIVCHGQLFPPMVGGVLYEHGHRLAAMTVGFLQIALTVFLWRQHPALRRLGVVLLGLVIFQGLLGATTVAVKLHPLISSSHLVLGMSYFATLIYTVFQTRRAPTLVELEAHHAQVVGLGAARTWILAAATVVMVQLLLGAFVRHFGAALVCLGMPSCTMDGSYWLAEGVQRLHMIHRAMGLIVAAVVLVAGGVVLRHARAWPLMRKLALTAMVVVLLQVVLGVYVVLTMRNTLVAVGHFAGAASLWALWISAVLALRPRAVDAGLAVPETRRHQLVTAPAVDA